MAQKQLNIRSDEAAARAAKLSRRLGKSTTEVVVDALRVYDLQHQPADQDGLTASEREEFEALCTIAHRAADARTSSLSSDHSWLYDEHGLPK